jgi:hypothetical protein
MNPGHTSKYTEKSGDRTTCATGALGVWEIVTWIGSSNADSAVADIHRREPNARGARAEATGSRAAAIRWAAAGAAVAALRAACVSLFMA